MHNIYVNAVNCHTGGGKTLLNGFLKGLAVKGQSATVFIDGRYKPSFVLPPQIVLIPITLSGRLSVSSKIRKMAGIEDTVLYFGNLPPLLKLRAKNVLLLLSSRFYVDGSSFSGFSWKDRLKIFLEKQYFNLFLRNVTGILVQTSTMRKLVQKAGIRKKILVCAFDDIGSAPDLVTESYNKEAGSFIYVASLMPYKNHKLLLQAWKLLKDEGISPKLCLTLDQDNQLRRWIEVFVAENDLNVEFLKNLPRNELIEYYKKTETLIYPSSFEAYGLPLIEARKFQLKILSADVDYSWDFITPDDYFNPFDAESITRAVKRSLGIKYTLDRIYSPEAFIDKLLDA